MVGRFHPLHRGHEDLIAAAVALGDPVYVLSYASPESDGCGAAVRRRWLARLEGITRVVVASVGVPPDEASPAEHRAFCAAVCARHGWPISTVATGEDYGPGLAASLAAALGRAVTHHRVDRQRLTPVSGTQVRADPFAERERVSPEVMASYLDARRADVLARAGLTRAALYDAFLGRLDEVDEVVDFLQRVGFGGRVLDAGCGTGRLLPAMTARGWNPMGLDLDEDYVTLANTRGEAVVAGFEEAGALGAFDGIVVANGPLIYPPDRTTRIAALRGLAQALAPGGRLVVDAPDLQWIAEHYATPTPRRVEVGGRWVCRRSRHEIDATAGVWTHVDDVEVEGAGTYQEIWCFQMFSAQQLVAELIEVGLVDVQRWVGWSAMEPDGPRGARILLTARRKASQHRGGSRHRTTP